MEEVKRCKHCGSRLGDPNKARRYDSVCDEVLELDVDPYAEEIYGDSTEVWMCYGARVQSALDI